MYNGSMIAALLHVFPELPWDEAKFGNLRSKLGESREGRGVGKLYRDFLLLAFNNIFK
jgi:hypothetical protein